MFKCRYCVIYLSSRRCDVGQFGELAATVNEGRRLPCVDSPRITDSVSHCPGGSFNAWYAVAHWPGNNPGDYAITIACVDRIWWCEKCTALQSVPRTSLYSCHVALLLPETTPAVLRGRHSQGHHWTMRYAQFCASVR